MAVITLLILATLTPSANAGKPGLSLNGTLCKSFGGAWKAGKTGTCSMVNLGGTIVNFQNFIINIGDTLFIRNSNFQNDAIITNNGAITNNSIISNYGNFYGKAPIGSAVVNDVNWTMTISNPTINGVTSPVRKAIPVLSIENDQYTGSISWSSNSVPLDGAFVAETSYTATVTITPKAHYTLTGIGSNFFTLSSATTVSNSSGSGIITAVFPATNPTPTYKVSYSMGDTDQECQGGSIQGVTEQYILEGNSGTPVEAMPFVTSGTYLGRNYDGCSFQWDNYVSNSYSKDKIITAENVKSNEDWYVQFYKHYTN